MEAKDLMIGDWVYKDGNPYKIKENFDRIFFEEFGECSPILITPEILEKNGFCVDKCDGMFFCTLKEKNVRVHFSGDHVWCCIESSDHLNIEGYTIRYIHELQHALTLCGIDIEIEL